VCWRLAMMKQSSANAFSWQELQNCTGAKVDQTCKHIQRSRVLVSRPSDIHLLS
jgi:hypothetical protein